MNNNATVPATQRLTVMLNSRDHLHHHSLATEVLARARHARLAGATLLQAVEGHGRSGTPHRQRLFAKNVPLSIVIVDIEPKIARFVEELHRVAPEALIVVVEDVAALRA